MVLIGIATKCRKMGHVSLRHVGHDKRTLRAGMVLWDYPASSFTVEEGGVAQGQERFDLEYFKFVG